MFERNREICHQKIKELSIKKQEISRLRAELLEIETKLENYSLIFKPSFFDRIFKPSLVKEYENNLAYYNSLKIKYEELKSIYESMPSEKEINKKLQEFKIQFASDNVKTIIEYNKKNNILNILTEEDKKYVEGQIESSISSEFSMFKREINSVEDIMLIHKTNYAPKDEVIGTRLSSEVIDTSEVIINGVKYDVKVRPVRDTVHFSVNHEVSSHGGGNWDDCKYAVLVPLLSIPKEQFGSNRVVDTFTKGKVKLTDQAYIICPQEEIEKVQKDNPKVTIISYEGTNVKDYAKILLWMLGYSVERGNEWGLENTYNANKYYNIMTEAGYKKFTSHFKTDYKEQENNNFYISYFIGILELIMNNSEICNIDTQVIIEETEIGRFVNKYYTSIKNNKALFDYYLSEINFSFIYQIEEEGTEAAINFCTSVIDTAKAIQKQKNEKCQEK